jgi:uncharacterized protein YcbX
VSAHVCALLVTPVKSLRVTAREEVAVGPAGVLENRRFFLVDADGRMVNGKRLGALQSVVAEYSHDARELAMRFPDGRVLRGEVASGEPLVARFHSTAMPGRTVEGPWSAALSRHAGAPLRLVESDLPEGAVDRGGGGTVSLVSRATLERLAAEAGAGSVDGRRMRMLVEIDGVGAGEEDGWIGRPLRIGGAVITLTGHTGRCVVTTRDPESGAQTLDTLRLLARYRLDVPTTEPLACGVHGSVSAPGRVRVGDPVELL